MDPSRTDAKKVSAEMNIKIALESFVIRMSFVPIWLTKLVALIMARWVGRKVRDQSAKKSWMYMSADGSIRDLKIHGSRSARQFGCSPRIRESIVDPVCEIWKMKSQRMGSSRAHGERRFQGTLPEL
jgi:hypothetical protein